VRNSNEILGGYNPNCWDSTYTNCGTAKDSFLFSFKNNNVNNYILSRIRNDMVKVAMVNDPGRGVHHLVRTLLCMETIFTTRVTLGKMFVLKNQ
jgi:hypothetical protein